MAPPAAALSVSPPHVVVAAAESTELRVTNRGGRTAVVDVSATGLALGLRGSVRLLARQSPVRARPRRVVIPAHGSATIAVSSTLPRSARPGDHAAVVLLTTRPARSAVAVRLRLGVIALVRIPGTLVHRLVPEALRRRRGVLELWLTNRGNAAEELGTLRVHVLRRGKLVAVLRPAPRSLLPGARGVCVLRYPRGLHGRLRAVVLGVAFRLRL